MLHIIAGGKPSKSWLAQGIAEYEKRLRKPFDLSWTFYPEDKLEKYLASWPFKPNQYIILLDERGDNLSSPELSKTLEAAFVNGREVILIIGGAFGVDQSIREKANLVWSLSRLVFPHELTRLILAEQLYRAYDISHGGKYHHS